jgi:ABC-2 type transport system ATP-binding protein
MTDHAASSAPVLQLDHLSRRRAGRRAVECLNLQLQRGQVLGLLGVNGAGKSTTLSMIAGALRPDSGSIRLNGEDFLEYPESAARLIGWLPERAPRNRRHARGQRLGLACALLHKPALLVLDEPANALDPVQVAALRAVIREQAAAGTAVILSTHLLTEVTAVCDRVAILHEGTLRHDGPVHGDDYAALERTFFDIAMHGNASQARAA